MQGWRGWIYRKAVPAECSRLIYACSVSHHQVYLIPGGQPLQELTAQLVAQNAGLAQAALKGLFILLAGM